MDVLIVSLAPVAIIAGYICARDRYEREPVRLLLLAILSGALIVLPVMFVENLMSRLGNPLNGIAEAAWKAFAVAGLTEETFKFLALYLLIWKSREFNDKYDGIVYGTFISLGFAGIENVLYVSQEGNATGLIRAFTAVPAHAVFGITMGFYLGMAKFYPKRMKYLKYKSLLIPILLHGIYDFILMTEIDWLWIIFLCFVVFLYISGVRRMKILTTGSYYRTDFELLNKTFNKKDESSDI